jgi:hypothetical protein
MAPPAEWNPPSTPPSRGRGTGRTRARRARIVAAGAALAAFAAAVAGYAARHPTAVAHASTAPTTTSIDPSDEALDAFSFSDEPAGSDDDQPASTSTAAMPSAVSTSGVASTVTRAS